MKPTATIDIGTTRVKLCVFDADGRLARSEAIRTPSVRDAWGPVYDLDALTSVISDFFGSLGADVRGTLAKVAFCGVGESGGLVASDLSLRSPMILWHDQRGALWLDRLSASDRALIYRVTGLPANPNYGLSKVAWAAEAAGSGRGDACWLNISEYLAATLTGERWAEHSLASRTMALDLIELVWSEEICQLVDVDTGYFPPLHPAAHGRPIAAHQAAALGLPASVDVHVVGHDHIVGGVGADLHHGELLNSTGTTEGLLLLTDQPSLDAATAETKLANGRGCRGSDFTLFASIPTGGAAFEGLQGMLGMSADALAALTDDLARRYADGEIDLSGVPVVVPQFRGSPPPEKSHDARGLIAGLSTDTRAEDMVFGCFLGQAIQFRKVLDLFGTPVSGVKVIGPASRNPLWLQLKADVLGVDLSVSTFPEVVSRGAQALVSGEHIDWRTTEPWTVRPDADRRVRIDEWYADAQRTMHRIRALDW